MTKQAQQLSKSAKRKLRQQRKQAQPQPVAVQRQRTRARVERVFDQYVSEGALLAKQMALPEGSLTPFRLPTADMPRTAVLKSSVTFNVNTPTAEFTNIPQADQTTLMTVVLGRPGCSLMYGPTKPSVTATANAMYRTFTFMNNTGGTQHGGFDAFTYLAKSSTISLPFRPLKDVAGAEKFPLANSRGYTYFWFDHGCSLMLNANAASLKFSIQFTWFRYLGPGEDDAIAGNFTLNANDTAVNGATSNPTLGSGWYRLVFEFTNPSATEDITGSDNRTLIPSIIFGDGSGGGADLNVGVFRFSCPDVTQDATIGGKCRRTACSVLMTNSSSEINQQGTVVAGRALFDDIGRETTGTTFSVSDVAKLANKYTGKAHKGCFTYMDFDQGCEVFEQACNELLHPTLQLDPILYMHVILITNPASFTLPNSYIVTVQTHYEFLTDSMKYPTTVPTAQYQSLIEARRINNATEYFYENPLHPGDIWRFIRNSFNAMRRVAVPIGLAASTLFPEAGGAIMPIAHALQI